MPMNSTTTTNTHTRSSKSSPSKERLDKIPNKLGFKIGEVAKFVGVKSYVLRYWETEFETLRPKKSSNGQRLYTRKDIEMALTIRKLLYEDRFSIEGAKSALKKMKSMSRAAQQQQTSMAKSAPPTTSQVSPQATATQANSRRETTIDLDTTERELLESHKPAAEVVVNKSSGQVVTGVIDYQQELHEKIHAKHSPTQEELEKREKEITQFWVSSLDYLVEEIRQARKRLMDAF